MARLGAHGHGKAEVRLVRIFRGGAAEGGAADGGAADELRDWTVSSRLSGDFSETYLTGDNTGVLTTDAQKNAVYALAAEHGDRQPEQLALRLAGHFAGQPQVSRARVEIAEHGWRRVGDRAHSFAGEPGFTRTATVVTDRQQGRLVLAGLRDLTLLNTTRSEFAGFARDRYTTLPETADRVLATSVTARWSYREPGTHDWAGCFDRARTALVEAFADTYSHSLQQTLYAMGERVLRALPEADQVRLVLPNRHHFLVDLQPFGLANENEVYLAADRPYGVIEGAVLADDAVPGGQLPWD